MSNLRSLEAILEAMEKRLQETARLIKACEAIIEDHDETDPLRVELMEALTVYVSHFGEGVLQEYGAWVGR